MTGGRTPEPAVQREIVPPDPRFSDPESLVLVEETRARLDQERKDSGVRRHTEIARLYCTILVVLVILGFSVVTLLFGDPALHPLASHLLAGIGGVAAGQLWRGPGSFT